MYNHMAFYHVEVIVEYYFHLPGSRTGMKPSLRRTLVPFFVIQHEIQYITVSSL
ncbi:MAG TPA: hypothetical protein PLA68_11710 [Panacibacter sp.]|nr:hypothetical protein [Panacibacter sp.]